MGVIELIELCNGSFKKGKKMAEKGRKGGRKGEEVEGWLRAGWGKVEEGRMVKGRV